MESQTFYYTTPSGTELHYVQNGNPEGPLLICLHGLGGSTATFEPLLPFIPSHFKTIFVDFPGHGKSPISSEKVISVKNHASDLGHLVTHLQGAYQEAARPKIVLIGHSLGTAVGMHYAAQEPEIVAGLVLIAPIQSGAKIPPFRERMLELAANTRKEGILFAADLAAETNFPADDKREVDSKHREAIRSIVAGTNTEGYAQTCEAIVSSDHENPDYSKVVCPISLIAGDMDMISPVARSESLKEQLGGDSSVTIVKSGHQPILEDIQPVAAAVLQLLNEAKL